MPKDKGTTRRRAADLPTTLDEWVQAELNKRPGTKFSPWLVQVLYKVKELQEEKEAERG